MRIGRVLMILGAAAVLAGTALAASLDNPVLEVETGQQKGATDVLAIDSLDIDVTITGDTARTVVTAKFLNPKAGAMEGGFTFDLPPNSVVTGYALDVGGRMVDGVLVGKRQATVTYEQRVRRGIDPGLAEITRTGAFKTRIYPILAKTGRTVKLTFVTPLDPGRLFTIPLNTSAPVGKTTLHVTYEPSGTLLITAPKGFSEDHSRKGFHASLENQKLSGEFAVAIGTTGRPPVFMARHPSGETFLEIDDAVSAAKPASAHPDHVRIFWDSSLSRRNADLNAEIDLVGRYIAAVQPAVVDLVFFSTDEPQMRSFRAPKPGEITAVLKTTDYHGGTSLSPLFRADQPQAATCLLFSDGNMTVDSYHARRAPCRLSTISSASDANRALLAALAAKSGGDYLDLRTEKDALARLTSPAPRVVDVRSTRGDETDYVLLPAPQNRFRLILRDPPADGVVVHFAGAAQAARSYATASLPVADTETLGALWALRRIDDLNATDRPDRDAIIGFSRRYSIASSEASFVVFENLSDYVEAKAEPPASAGPVILAGYKQQMRQAADEQARIEAERLDKVIKLWTAEKTWWNTVFKYDPSRKPKTASDRDARPVPPPPPPPPSPMMAPAPMNRIPAEAQDSAGVMESVVLTGVRGGEPAGPQGPSIEVKIEPWHPDRPYIKALDAAKPEALWYAYREQEKQYGNIPAFYLDMAEYMFRHKRSADAVKIVLNALELPSANTTTFIIVADRLMRYGDEARAVWLYERILWLEPDRPQPRRNLALALMAQGDAAKAPAEKIAKYRRALDLLNEVATKVWDEKYDGIEVISLMEANRIITRLKPLGVTKVPLDKRLIAMLDVDMRIILEWNTDETDMDLWVDEPTGERCIYNHPATGIGGRLSNDMTNGYGPEQYLLHRAPNGEYIIRANVYRRDSLDPNGATTIRAHVFRNYGRANEQEQTLDLELSGADAKTPILGKVKVSGQKN